MDNLTVLPATYLSRADGTAVTPHPGVKLDGGLPWPAIHVDREKLLARLAACQAAGVRYGPRPGFKAPNLNAEPGREFHYIDCSGFFRWAVWGAAHVVVPDGSVVQHDWVREQGFKKSGVYAGKLTDNILRVAFL